MIFAYYKKIGPTSRDVLNYLQSVTGMKKIGHGGTLDPLAEGVLVVGIGRESTKKLHKEDFNEKEYIAVLSLGKETITLDREGEKKKNKVKNTPELKRIKEVLEELTGIIMQEPPSFSAVKIDGKEAYKWARKGIIKKPKARPAEIKKIEIMSYRYPFLKIRVLTGRGVYIRSLARDIGESLGCGGYLYTLKRIKVGPFTLDDCISKEVILKKLK